MSEVVAVASSVPSLVRSMAYPKVTMRPVPDRDIDYRKPYTGLLQFPVPHTQVAHVIGTGLLAPDEVVGVMRRPHLVGLGIPHAELNR